MTLHAVDDIDDAIDATKSFLFPFEVGTWLRLAFVVFFIGGGGGGLNLVRSLQSAQNFGNGGASGPGGFSLAAPVDALAPGLGALLQVPTDVPVDAPDALAGLGLAAFVAIAVTVLLIALLFAILGATMEFAFAQALIDREVHVRRYVSRHLGNGLRLLAFRILVNVLSLFLFGGLLLAVLAATVGLGTVTENPPALLGSFALVAVVLVLGVLVVGTIQGFTNVFVVPMIVDEGYGILAGWRRLWQSMTGAPKQYLAYLFFSVVLGIGVGIVGGILGAIAAVVVAIPFGIVGAVFWFALGGGTAAGVAIGLLGLLFALTMLVVANMVKAPLQAFLRYYAMLVLGDTDSRLDPVSQVRRDIRT